MFSFYFLVVESTDMIKAVRGDPTDPHVQFNDNESVLGGSVSTINTDTTAPSSYEVIIRERITLDFHCSVNPTLLGGFLSTHGWINLEMFLAGFIHPIFLLVYPPITVIS